MDMKHTEALYFCKSYKPSISVSIPIVRFFFHTKYDYRSMLPSFLLLLDMIKASWVVFLESHFQLFKYTLNHLILQAPFALSRNIIDSDLCFGFINIYLQKEKSHFHVMVICLYLQEKHLDNSLFVKIPSPFFSCNF